MEYLENTREYKAAMALEDALNSITWDEKKFAQSVRFMHRTLQQNLFRTVIATIREMGSDDFLTDDRNQAAHDIAKKILESGALDVAYLPHI